jgi:cytidylate kinase
VADRLGYKHVDTGAMYRAVAWKALQDALPLDEDEVVSRLAEQADIVQQDGRTAIDGHDVTSEIRTPAIDKAATSVARLPHVREALVRRFRELGAGGAVVMEGRDIGTVVFPDADLKFYIDASPEERARRRASDPAHTGGQGSLELVQSDIAARDKSDSTRSVAPLARANDAIYIDTTSMPIEAVVSQVLKLVEERLE